jgi:YesN/AraC family two-component response regulator
MPSVDGLELTRQIRAAKRTRYTHVMMLTALGGPERYLEGMRAGVDDFVTKPVSPEELHARLRVAERILSLQDNMKLLEGVLHICMYCKKVHVAGADWTGIEGYIEERSDASFSHDICPGCYATRVAPDLERLTGHDVEPKDDRDRR